MGETSLRENFSKSAHITRVVVCKVPSPRARIADLAVNTMGGGCCRREALGISTLDSESSDRGSNPREVSYGAKHSSLGVRLPIQGGPREISANVTFTWIFEFQNIPDSKSVGHILR